MFSILQTVCEKYWPAISSIIQRSGFTVTGKSEKSFGEIIKRIFIIKEIKTQVGHTQVVASNSLTV